MTKSLWDCVIHKCPILRQVQLKIERTHQRVTDYLFIYLLIRNNSNFVFGLFNAFLRPCNCYYIRLILHTRYINFCSSFLLKIFQSLPLLSKNPTVMILRNTNLFTCLQKNWYKYRIIYVLEECNKTKLTTLNISKRSMFHKNRKKIYSGIVKFAGLYVTCIF